MNEITINQLTFMVEKSLLFNKLELNLTRDKITGLFGKNGAGKTTLLKILAGLIFPRQGQYQVFGKLPSERSPTFLSDIYYIPGNFLYRMSQQHDLNIYTRPFIPNLITHILENLTAFELPTDRWLSKLSYRQRKKFLIAFGLAAHTRLLLLMNQLIT